MGRITWTIHHYGECDYLDDVPSAAVIDSIDDVDVYGSCGGCGRLIMDGDEYGCDEDGVMLCPRCMDDGH